MGKAIAIGEAIIAFKELFGSASDLFSEMIPGNFYESLDTLAFLNSEILAINGLGEIIDGTKKIGDAVLGLTNFFVWGLLLFHAFRSLFGYFISKNVDLPWKLFIRIIIFGILANASFFICFTGVFFIENSTRYIRECGGYNNTSFSCLDNYIIEDDIEELKEGEKNYTIEAMLSVFMYFCAFFIAICLGGRYIMIKFLILFSPIFVVLGGFKESERIFLLWIKKLSILLSMQLPVCVFLGVTNMCDLQSDIFTQILVASALFVMIKNVLKFLSFSCFKC